MDNDEFIKTLDNLKPVIQKLQKEGPVRMKNPLPGEPDIILTAEYAKEMISAMEDLVLGNKEQKREALLRWMKIN